MALEFTVDPELTDELRAEIVACWTDVTNAGGSVGFVPPITMDDVHPTAARYLAGVAAGRDNLIIGREVASGDEDEADHRELAHGEMEHGEMELSQIEHSQIKRSDMEHSEIGHTTSGRLAALAFLTDEQSRLTEHWRTVKKVMVHPDFQGRGYGTLLMAELERVARAMGLALLALDCRGGTGNDEFYKKCGYVEYGRLPGALRIGADEYRDRVLMTLALRG